MQIKQHQTEHKLCILLSGEFDALSCGNIRPELEKIIADCDSDVAIDLQAVNFIDSSGIGAIVFLYKRLKAQGQTLEIINIQGQPKELFELLRIHSAIPVSCLDSNASLVELKPCEN